MSNLENELVKRSSISTLHIKKRKKNDYVRLEAGAYPQMFLQQLEEAASALATGKLSKTGMVKRDKRSGRIILVIGYGKRPVWFENRHLGKGMVAEYESTAKALREVQALIENAKAGEFDEALEKLRIRRQEHAETMIEARDKCGFHRKGGPKGDAETQHDAYLTSSPLQCRQRARRKKAESSVRRRPV